MSTLVVIDTHDGGQVNDPRDPRTNVVRNIQHFDNYTNPKKLTPYRSMVADLADAETTLDADKIQMFCSGNGTIYGLGRAASGNSHTEIFGKLTPADMTTGWTPLAGSATYNDGFLMFLYYNNYLYGGNGHGVWKYGDVTSSPSFTDGDSTSYIPTGQGIVHSADNVMYFPVGNVVVYNNTNAGGSGYGVGFTLASGSKITALCEFGNYLAIGYNLSNGKCAVGMWDRDVTNTQLAEKVDWGIGSLLLLETVEGTLCGISTTGNSTNSLAGLTRVYFKSYEYSYLSSYEGLNTVNTFAELVCSAISVTISSQQRFNELFYFLGTLTLANGIFYQGLWKIFRNAAGAMAVSFDILPQNGTSLGNGILYGFYRYGDYIFIAFEKSDGTNTVWRTNDQVGYIATSEWDTTINQGMTPEDRVEKKKLLAVGALYEPLPSAAIITVQYRVDGGSWVTIFTETTDGQVRTEPQTNAGANGAFTDGFEYEFRVQSTGGGEVTALIYKYDTIKTTSNS